MIIKALSRTARGNGSGQLVRYVLRYSIDPKRQTPDKQLSGEIPFLIKHNIRSHSIEGYIKEFKQNELNRIHTRSNQTALNHFIISFSPDDTRQINDKKLRAIVKKFIQLRGENNLYVGSKHEDKQHCHLHIVCSATQINGLSSRISKKELANLKDELTAYQIRQFPELVNSLPFHGRSKALKTPLRGQEPIERNFGRESHKKKLIEALQASYSKAKSSEAFLKDMQSRGYILYYRAGRLAGVKFENRKFRLNRLGYDAQKISGIDVQQMKVKNELANLRAIRVKSQLLERDENIEMPRFRESKNVSRC